MKRKHIWCVVAVAALALAASSVPVFAADNGTVAAHVVVGGGACLTVTASVDFGSLQFQLPNATGATTGAPSIVVTNCASGSETILARGTDATAPGVVWSLTTTAQCAAAGPINLYNLGLRLAGGGDTFLSTTNTSLGATPPAQPLTRTPILRMPCTGSGGTGQTMNMSYVFTATLP